ncbi:MAG: ankyrin repeat domain-containing protein [Epsilonproteobacteria bacterium]|nr:ankyrin repeat domain-containing protein [Campylobacterota bacterium]
MDSFWSALTKTAAVCTSLVLAPTQQTLHDIALCAAAQNNDVQSASRLLTSSKASINTQDPLGRTPLRIAALEGNVEMIRLLLKHHAHTTMPDNEGWTPMFAAISTNKPAVVEALLEHDQTLANTRNNKGLMPLHKAVSDYTQDTQEARKAIIMMLLAYGAQINAPIKNPENRWGSTYAYQVIATQNNIIIPDNEGWTPLHQAADACSRNDVTRNPYKELPDYRIGDTDVIELLLRNGADPKLTDYKGRRPQQLAKSKRVLNAFAPNYRPVAIPQVTIIE